MFWLDSLRKKDSNKKSEVKEKFPETSPKYKGLTFWLYHLTALWHSSYFMWSQLLILLWLSIHDCFSLSAFIIFFIFGFQFFYYVSDCGVCVNLILRAYKFFWMWRLMVSTKLLKSVTIISYLPTPHLKGRSFKSIHFLI